MSSFTDGSLPFCSLPRSSERGFQEQFEAQARQAQDRIAVVYEGIHLTYSELNKRANQLAQYLRSKGVGLEVRVALCVERGIEMVVGLLGILKAGGVYVPLDPSYPQERLAMMLDDSRASLLLTQRAVMKRLAFGGRETVASQSVALDAQWSEISKHQTSNPQSGRGPENLAYVIYTSGSTGRPKGVMVLHRGLANVLQAQRELFDLTPDDRVLQFSSFSFDASVFEVLLAVGSGAKLCLAPREALLPGPDLAGLLRNQGVSIATVPPSALAALPPGEQASLHTLLVAGEACPGNLVPIWSRGRRFFNLYGPTEATIWSTAAQCTQAIEPVPIGTPIANTKIFISSNAKPDLENGSGELYIGGIGLARGYMNRPDLTAMNFLPNPFNTAPGERLYRTGDRVRRGSNGTLEFLGRVDHQVKVRGYRIELGEIEASLRAHPGVREVVVIAREDSPGQKRIAAYIVFGPGEVVGSGDLRRYLGETLPEYMVPSHFVFLERLPLSPNGKVDRNSLPAPPQERPELGVSYVPPKTLLEKALVAIWSDVLGLVKVGINDNFFDLGGHSLLAIQIITRVRQSLDIDLPVTALLHSVSIADLASKIEKNDLDRPSAGDLPLRRVPRDQPLPASFAQEAIWFLQKTSSELMAYNAQATLRLLGPLDVPLLERAMNEIIRRHEIFRTSFTSVEGRPFQVIHEPWTIRLPITDLGRLSCEDQAVQLERLRKTEFGRPMDIGSLPLVRWRLARFSEVEHEFLHVEHHFIHDGWSFGVYLNELKALYEAFLRGEPSPLEELSIHFADYAVWQRSWMKASQARAQLDFWDQKLKDVPTLIELPTDRPRPAEFTYRGAAHREQLSSQLTEKTRSFARRERTTLYVVTLAVFESLLHRYCGQESFCVGASMANRRQAELEPLIGMLVNMVPLRAAFGEGLTFRKLVKRVHDEVLQAQANQEAPFEQIVERVKPPRTLGHNPIFQVSFNHHDSPMPEFCLGPVSIVPMEAHNIGSSKFDLSVTVIPRAHQRQGREVLKNAATLIWEYSTDLFDASTIGRMYRHYTVLLKRAFAHADRRVSDLSLMTREETYQITCEWNDSEATDPGHARLHVPFQQKAAEVPDAVALIAEGKQLTYRELEARADRLAGELRELDVRPESVVAICLERSMQMVIGILGTLKAGGAFLPLDPAHPAERLSFMLRDADAQLLITRDQYLSTSFANYCGPTLLIENLETPRSRTTAALPTSKAAVELAYVIYTSGSTGTPKGVMISHSAIKNRILWAYEHFPLDVDDRVLLKTPFTFDAFVWELFLPLWSGAGLVLAPAEAHKDPSLLVREVIEHRVSWLQLVPSVLQVFLAQQNACACKTLRLLFCGGEALPTAMAQSATASLSAQVVNLYGPTEVSIDISSWKYRGQATGHIVPIGRPISNTRVYLVNKALHLAPIGAIGELFATGPGLARGYLGRASLTAERFIPNPFGSECGERVYQTGDLARKRADGAIEFLGRTDYQVKLRGLRIELGEIEAVLLEHPALKEAVVASRGGESGGDYLAAYLVPVQSQKWAPGELRAFLRQRLPEYMVPTSFVALTELPRTTSGKVDRRKLPEPEVDLRNHLDFTPPRSPEEEILVEIWSEILHARPIGVHDGFFDLGGHSLSALQVLARINTVWGVEMPLRTLFDTPTIAELAGHLKQLGREEAAARIPPLVPFPRKGPMPVSFAQQRLWLLYQLEPESPAYNIPVVLRLPQELDEGSLRKAISDLVRRHEVLRTTFTSVDGLGFQHIHSPRPVQLPSIDLRDLTPGRQREGVRAIVRQEVLRFFDLEAAPPLRATLVRRSEREDLLVVVIHHIVCDGWSMEVLKEELQMFQEARLQREGFPLPELPVQYADYAQWERMWLKGEVLEAHLAYWRERLAGAPEVIGLSTDRARPSLQSYRGDTTVMELPADLCDSLRALSREASATLFMTLLGSLKVFLHRYGAGDDIVVGTHVANRGRLEIERLIGFFVNALVLRTDLSNTPSFSEVVARVRETALGAFAHQHVPFDRIVEELQPERDLSITPLYQVSFDLQRGGIYNDSAHELLSSSPTVKFDLDFTVVEGHQELQLRLAYSTDLFDRVTANRMLRHWCSLVRSAMDAPGRHIGRHCFLSAPEAHQLRCEFQGERRDFSVKGTLDQLIQDQTDRTPDRVALVSHGKRITYAELNSKAENFARRLVEMGTRRGDFIGILEERSADFIIGVVAILKAGGAYLPLDPAYPAGRLRHMLLDSAASILLTSTQIASEFVSSIKESSDLKMVICFDDPPTSLVKDLNSDVRVIGSREVSSFKGVKNSAFRRVHPRDPAYILYTSGSTGLAKAAVIRHDGAVNHIFAQVEALELGPQLSFLQSAPSSSDISVWQMLAPLVIGGRTVVADNETVTDAEALLQIVKEERISILELVPAVLRNLLEHAVALPPADRSLPNLRWMMATGETVPVDLVNAWIRTYSDVGVVNAYGPTEASDDVAQLILQRPLPDRDRSVPIGRPLANIDCHVLDRTLRPVPVGVPGELCIAGLAVGSGYHRNPQRTSTGFVPNPSASWAGEVLYRTGDSVRWLPQGDLEFFGRIDHQVKIRGFRIDLGEIECVLRECRPVRDCAVVVREEEGDRSLAAYLVAASDASIEEGRLREHLRERLPEYMVPSIFVTSTDPLPTTPAGKVDRRALMADRQRGVQRRENIVSPRTATESTLAGIWVSVLKREEVSVEADFFDLGGHSLMAAMVASRVQNVLGVKLPLRKFFQLPTIARLAKHIEELSGNGHTTHNGGPGLKRVVRKARRVSTVSDGILKSL